ncbi:Dnahc8_0 protein [Gryllus bimaculatus]|nr:Dnahc8_0 protein [Gryllus bimaculatus]
MTSFRALENSARVAGPVRRRCTWRASARASSRGCTTPPRLGRCSPPRRPLLARRHQGRGGGARAPQALPQAQALPPPPLAPQPPRRERAQEALGAPAPPPLGRRRVTAATQHGSTPTMSTIEPVVGRPIKSLSCLDMTPLEEAEKHITNTMSMTRKTRRMSTFAVMQQESMRERLGSGPPRATVWAAADWLRRRAQNKAREERSTRAASLTGNHRHVMEAAAFHLNVEPKVVEDGVLDSWSHVKHMESFMAEGGRRAIFFFYQEFDEGPSLGTCNISQNKPHK